MNTLKAKIMLLLLVIATITAFSTEVRADGNPFPICNKQVCIP